MAQNITLLGASYSDVPSVLLPKTGGGTAQFDDTTDANATATDIANGKTAYVNGAKVTGTASGGGNTYKTGTVTYSQTYNTQGNVKIVDLSTIGFTPSKFYFLIHDQSTISGKQNAILRASYESLNGTAYLRIATKYTNTSNTISSVNNAASWTTQTTMHLYCDGTTIYYRATSNYVLFVNTTYDWIAIP